MTDNELLAQYVRGGSHEAFAEIVRRYADMVYATCRRELGDDHAAEDATQATFLVLMRKAGSLSRKGALSGWLFRVAEFAARDVRKLRARRAQHEKEAAEVLSETGMSEAAAWEETRPLLNAALARLPRAQQEAIALRYLRGLPVPECARELGCPQKTVRTRLDRALARLRKGLARKGAIIPVAFLGGLLAEHGIETAPTSLVASIQATVAGQGATTASVLALTEEVMKAMLWAKLKLCAAVVCAAAAVGIGVPVVLSAAESGPEVTAKDEVIKAEVLAVKGGKVTLSVGADHGVRVGFEFDVARDGKKVAVLKVTEVAGTRSTGELVNIIREVKAGDAAATRLTVVDAKPTGPAPGAITQPGNGKTIPNRTRVNTGYLRKLLGEARFAAYTKLLAELRPKMGDAAARYEFAKTRKERERADAERHQLAARLERKAAELLALLTPDERKRYDAGCLLFAERVQKGKDLWQPITRRAQRRDPEFAKFEKQRRALLKEGAKRDDPRLRKLMDEYRASAKKRQKKVAPITRNIRAKEKALIEEYSKKIDAVLESTEKAEEALKGRSMGTPETF